MCDENCEIIFINHEKVIEHSVLMYIMSDYVRGISTVAGRFLLPIESNFIIWMLIYNILYLIKVSL